MRGEGVYLYTEDGRRLLDGISSWWVNIHGHSHPRLNEALADQARELEHVDLRRLHAPAGGRAGRAAARSAAGRADARVLLGQRIDGRRSRGEDGRAVLEQPRRAAAAALRRAAPRVSRRHGRRDVGERGLGLHAAVRAAAVPRRARARAVLLPLSARPRPRDVRHRRAWPISSRRCATLGGTAAAVLVEPMLQGAGGMIVWPAEFLAGVRRLCDQYGVADDRRRSAHRFGRTGRMFACEHAAVAPDIICLSKALTAGYLPLGVTADDRRRLRRVSQRRSQPHVLSRPLVHGQSAGVRGGDREPRSVRGTATSSRASRRLEAQLRAGLAPLRDLPIVGDVRVHRRRRHRRAGARQDDEGGRRLPRHSSGRACPPRFSSADCCCGRSATCCTSCRRTSSRTTRWTG